MVLPSSLHVLRELSSKLVSNLIAYLSSDSVSNSDLGSFAFSLQIIVMFVSQLGHLGVKISKSLLQNCLSVVKLLFP